MRKQFALAFTENAELQNEVRVQKMKLFRGGLQEVRLSF